MGVLDSLFGGQSGNTATSAKPKNKTYSTGVFSRFFGNISKVGSSIKKVTTPKSSNISVAELMAEKVTTPIKNKYARKRETSNERRGVFTGIRSGISKAKENSKANKASRTGAKIITGAGAGAGTGFNLNDAWGNVGASIFDTITSIIPFLIIGIVIFIILKILMSKRGSNVK